MFRNSFHEFGLRLLALMVVFTVGPVVWAQERAGETGDNPCLLVVLEGLRPEFVTPSLMPNLTSLGEEGVRVTNHRAVFPAIASVNAASIATGAYPSTHGLIGETLVLPEIGVQKSFQTSDAKALAAMEEASGGKLLTAPTLGEMLAAEGKSFLAISSGTSASALLLDPKLAGVGIVHPELARSDSLAGAVSDDKEPGPGNLQNAEQRNAWAVNRYLDMALQAEPDVTILWLAEPRSTQRKSGLGGDANLRAIREVDAELGRILTKHRDLDLDVNVVVTSDGGFSTTVGAAEDLTRLLLDAGLKADVDSTDVVVVGGGSIYVDNHDGDRIRQIVGKLQQVDWVGAIYTQQIRPTHPEGIARGALSFQSIYLDHDRAPDILVEPAWSSERNAHGYPGMKRRIGEDANPTSSAYDLRVPFIAAGPGVKRRLESDVPSANSDLAPTLCYLMGIELSETMDGRVLYEILRGGPEPEAVEVLRRRHGSQAKWDGGRYLLMMTEYSVNGVDYLDSTQLER